MTPLAGREDRKLGRHVCRTKLARKIFLELRNFSRKMLRNFPRKFWAFCCGSEKNLKIPAKSPSKKKKSLTRFCRVRRDNRKEIPKSKEKKIWAPVPFCRCIRVGPPPPLQRSPPYKWSRTSRQSWGSLIVACSSCSLALVSGLPREPWNPESPQMCI